MKKYYWLSYVLFSNDQSIAFGNGYYGINDTYLDTRSMGELLRREFAAKFCTILFWKEVAEKEFDLSLARDVTVMEYNQNKE